MRFRLGLKWKIFSVLVVVAVLGQMVDLWYQERVITQAISNTEGAVKTILQQYLSYQRASSQSFAAAIDVWASSERLREALSRDDAAATRPLLMSMYSAIEQTLRPDLIVLIDRSGNVVLGPSSPVSEADIPHMRVFTDLRQGQVIRHQMMEHNGVAFLITGRPVQVQSQVVGGVLVGLRMQRLMQEFKSQDDDHSQRQLELALLHNGKLTATTLTGEQAIQMVDSVRQDRREVRSEGGQRVAVITLSGEGHEFHVQDLSGYDGPITGSVGRLYVLRSRLDKERRIEELRHNNLLVMALRVLASLLLAALLTAFVMNPIRRFISATDELTHGEGDLRCRLPVNSNDELGRLSHNLNQLFESLSRLVDDIAGASLKVGTSSEEISRASRRMLEGAKDQTLRIESSTAAVTELSASIQHVAENALQATKVARESGDKVQVAIDGMNRIKQASADAAEKIHELGEAGKRIGNIVEVIRQISEQTSLLALNASIEAAHAGEQGRGFAVVADEVSSLAKRVGQSARDIEDLIGTLRGLTDDAVRSMSNGTREVESGTHVVTQTLESLRTIIGMVQKTAAAVQEQAVVSDEIARNMDAARKVTLEVLTSSEEVVRHGDDLHVLSDRLKESVSGFQLAEKVAPGGRSGAGRE